MDSYGNYQVAVEPAAYTPGASLFGAGGGSGGLAGSGSPEGVVTDDPGQTYLDTSNGFFYVKQSGAGNVGWLAIVT